MNETVQPVSTSHSTRPDPVTGSSGESGSRRQQARFLDRAIQILGIGTFYVLVLIFFSATTPNFLSYSNTLNILSNVAVIGIVSIGQALVIISGGFDLSVSGVVPLGAVAYAVLVNAGVAVPAAIFAVVLIGAALGLVNGLVITRIGINPLVTTLATLSIASGLAYTISGGAALPFKDLGAAVLNGKTAGGVAYYVWAFLLLIIVGILVLRFTVFGRMLYALGGNREASRLAGIRVDLVTTSVYMISGGLAAFAGVVVSNQLLLGTPTVSADAALTSIAAVILGGAALSGGVGGIPGTVLGVLVLGTIANGMAIAQVPTYYQQIATGVVLLLAVGFGRIRAALGDTNG
jgi:ribose/xylose/arabinose/galactoside ABC-type transport system permease subunit